MAWVVLETPPNLNPKSSIHILKHPHKGYQMEGPIIADKPISSFLNTLNMHTEHTNTYQSVKFSIYYSIVPKYSPEGLIWSAQFDLSGQFYYWRNITISYLPNKVFKSALYSFLIYTKKYIKSCFSIKKLILTSERRVEHQFAG